MDTLELEKLRYPIGKFVRPQNVSADEIQNHIQTLEEFPSVIAEEVLSLDDEQLDTPYRDGGWTVRQVVHHLADSHMNAYIRFKLAMTEDTPTIKPYLEQRWAELPEAKAAPVEISLSIIETLHTRWTIFLRSMQQNDFKRKFFHPQSNAEQTLEQTLALYVWHSAHHLAHITSLKKRMDWE
jgi:uncharacterized damage-inducible protein DinB